MVALLIYALKVGICLAVFYLFFKLLLSRETLHRFNRLVLLGVLILSFVLPFCVITITKVQPIEPESELPLSMLTVEVMELEEIPTMVAEQMAKPFPWDQLCVGLYLLGVVAMTLFTLGSIAHVWILIRRGRREMLEDGSVLVLINGEVPSFSWWKYIVMSEADYAACGREIVAHEQAHLHLHHTWDLILTDLAGSMQWFNPAMWLLRRELRALHEYEADEAVLRGGIDARHYQLLLIKKAVGGRWCSVANSFDHSNLKNRITMMLQKRSSRWTGVRALFVVPLVDMALGAFAETVYLCPEDKGNEEISEMQIFGQSESEQTVVAVPEQSVQPSVQTQEPEAAEDTVRVFGTVTGNGEPLVGAVVRLVGSKQGAVTDKEGNYELRVPRAQQSATFEVMYVGYAKADMSVSWSGKGRIECQSNVNLLSQGDVSSSVDVYSAELTSAETAEKEQRMALLALGSGLSKENPLIVIDGQVMPSYDHLKPEQIKSIAVYPVNEEIQKLAEKYGVESHSGALVILTHEGASKLEMMPDSVRAWFQNHRKDVPKKYRNRLPNDEDVKDAAYEVDGKSATAEDVKQLKVTQVKSVSVKKGVGEDSKTVISISTSALGSEDASYEVDGKSATAEEVKQLKVTQVKSVSVKKGAGEDGKTMIYISTQEPTSEATAQATPIKVVSATAYKKMNVDPSAIILPLNGRIAISGTSDNPRVYEGNFSVTEWPAQFAQAEIHLNGKPATAEEVMQEKHLRRCYSYTGISAMEKCAKDLFFDFYTTKK